MLGNFEEWIKFGVPYGSRTRVAAVKGRCPRPLDERDAYGEQARAEWQGRNLANDSKTVKRASKLDLHLVVLFGEGNEIPLAFEALAKTDMTPKG